MESKVKVFSDKQKFRGGRQDGRRVGGHVRPLPKTHTKKPHLQVKRLAQNSNHWQKNLNSNNGKNLMMLLGKTRKKSERRESWEDGHSRKATVEEKAIPHPEKSPTGWKDQPNQRDL